MGDEHGGFAGHDLLEFSIHRRLLQRVQRRGRLVEVDHVAGAIDGAGHGDALPVAAGQLHAAEIPGQHGRQPVGEALLLHRHAGQRQRALHAAAAVEVGDSDVLLQRHFVAHVVLKHRAPCPEAVFDAARGRRVLTAEQLQQRRLARAVFAHDGHVLAFADGQGEVLNHVPVGIGIVEGDRLRPQRLLRRRFPRGGLRQAEEVQHHGDHAVGAGDVAQVPADELLHHTEQLLHRRKQR